MKTLKKICLDTPNTINQSINQSINQFYYVNLSYKVNHFSKKFLIFHKLICYVCLILILMSVHVIAKDETITFRDGSKYVGQVKDEQPHGIGTITWKNGSKYVGEFLDGKPHGAGRITFRDGATYIGQVFNDKPHGVGTYTWKDSSKYEGQWENGMKRGTGTYTWAKGKGNGLGIGLGAQYAISQSIKLFTEFMYDFRGYELRDYSVPQQQPEFRFATNYIISINFGLTYLINFTGSK